MVRFKSPTESEINILNLAQTFTAHTQQHKHLPHHIAPPDTKPCVSLNLIHHALLVVWRPIVLEELKKEEKKLEPSESPSFLDISQSVGPSVRDGFHLSTSSLAALCWPPTMPYGIERHPRPTRRKEEIRFHSPSVTGQGTPDIGGHYPELSIAPTK